MHDALYQHQPVWSQAIVGIFSEAYAESIGLNVAWFWEDRKNVEIQARVKA